MFQKCSYSLLLLLYTCHWQHPSLETKLPYTLWEREWQKGKMKHEEPCRLLWVIITVPFLSKLCAGWSSQIHPWLCLLGQKLSPWRGPFRLTRGTFCGQSCWWTFLCFVFPVVFQCHFSGSWTLPKPISEIGSYTVFPNWWRKCVQQASSSKYLLWKTRNSLWHKRCGISTNLAG